MTADVRYLDEITVGDTDEIGSYRVDEAEIMAFAERFDATLPPGAEPDGAAGPVASGWLVAAVCMRLTHESSGHHGSSLGGVGIDELRWLAPVRAGDRLRLRTEVLDTFPSESRSDRGYSYTRWEALTGDEVVLSLVVEELWPRRTGDGNDDP